MSVNRTGAVKSSDAIATLTTISGKTKPGNPMVENPPVNAT
jgi:hypothetical protein